MPQKEDPSQKNSSSNNIVVSVSPKKPIKFSSDKKEKNIKETKDKKKNEESESDEDSEHSRSPSEEDEIWSEDEDSDEELSDKKKAIFTKMLSNLFPSKYIKKKAQKLKNEMDRRKKRTKKGLEESENESEESSEEESSESEDEKYTRKTRKGKSRVDRNQQQFIVLNPRRSRAGSASNIIYIEDEDEDYDEDYDEDENEDEDDEDYETETTEEGSDDEEDEDDEDDDEEKDRKKKTEKENIEDILEALKYWNNRLETVDKELKDMKENSIKDGVKTERKNIKSEIKNLKKKEEKLFKKTKQKNIKEFRKEINNRNSTTDVMYFNKLNCEEQNKILDKIKEVNKEVRIDKPYRITLMESDIPAHFKACALKKINMLRQMEPGAGEYYKVKNWIDTFMKIPFGIYKQFNITYEDGVEKCSDFLENSKKILDDVVYGLDDAKMQIMQMVGQLITNPKAVGTAVAIHGPMGTGKTTLVKEGISKILGREFAFIALGGATDSSFLEGHSYTYEGSMWGHIVDILIKCQTMNPVIYFDELDKVSDTPKGEEIIGILTHLTDTSQNNEFHDKFFSEINFDLSKCLFIFSYNDESKINPILRDRMYRIKTKGYEKKDKRIISTQHLFPKVCEQVKFNEGDIIISDEIIDHIVENYTNGEQGIRTLKRCIETIYTKLNLCRLLKPGTKLFENETIMDVQFPFTITKDIVDKLIKTEHKANLAMKMMYC
jgi:ATP-dependent Lon protease